MDAIKKHGSIFMVILAGISWSFAGVLGKFVTWDALSLNGLRSIVAILLLGAARKSFRIVNTKWTWIGAFGVAATSLLFMFANKLTSSANAIVLQYAMTAIVIVVQILFMHKKARALDIIAACAVMGGVVLCFYQGFGSGALLGDILALISAVTWAIVFLCAKMPGVKALDYTYQGNLLGCAMLFAIPFDDGVATGGIQGWLVAAVMGVCLGLGYLFFSKGMQSSISPTVAAIISNIEPVLNPIWVFVFLRQSPGIYSIIGAAVVLCAVTVYSILNERKTSD